MKIKKVSPKTLKILKVLLYINTFILLGLGTYYLTFHIIKNIEYNFFDKYVFLPLLLAFIGSEVMIMSTSYNNGSYKSNNGQDNAMFNLGIIIEIIAVITIFGCIFINMLGK
jgi:hypothetical protein